MIQPVTFRVRQALAADEAALIALDLRAWSPESGFPSVFAAGRSAAAFFSEGNPPGAHLVAEPVSTGPVSAGSVSTGPASTGPVSAGPVSTGPASAGPGGQLLGYIRLKPPTPLPENAHVLLVAGLAVDPAARGQGVATALLAAAERQAIEAGARKLSLRVLGTNAVALRLYDRVGFVREGTLLGEFLIEGSYVDDVLMAKPLDQVEGNP